MRKLIVIAVSVSFLLGCAGRGLVSEHYDETFYRVEQLLPPDIAERNPIFIVYGDNQGCFKLIEDFGKQHNWWTWKQALIPFYQLYWLSNGVIGAVNAARTSADGGKDTRLMMRDVLYDAAASGHADFILNVGDICTHDGRRPAHWRKFLIENKAQSPLLNEIAYLPTAGNHERTSDERWGRPNFEAVFDYQPFYAVEFKDAELYVLDSEVICDLYSEMDDARQDELFNTWFISSDPEHPAWLEQSLAESQKRFKMVSMHIPPISFGRHFRDWIGAGDYGNHVPEKRRALLQLFNKYHVQVVFSGHEHIYQHNILHSTGAGTDRDLHIVVSSGGGVPLRYLPDPAMFDQQMQYFNDNGFDIESVMMQRCFHYTRVEVTDSVLTIKTYKVDEKHPENIALLETITIPAN